MDGESMLGQPAGWFRDPAPRDAMAPDTLRWWDGTAWTARTRTGSKRERRTWQAEAAAARAYRSRDLVERAASGDEEAQWQLAARTGTTTSRRTTPDGQRLAGLWARYAASLLDGMLLTVLGCLVAWRFLGQIAAAFQQFVDTAVRRSQKGRPMPEPEVLADAVVGPLLATMVIFGALTLAYEVGFLKRFAATPGKMALGLQVRPGHEGGPLSWRAALLRWSGKSGTAFVTLIPFGIFAHAVYQLLNHLWVVGDRNRQALHDKLARTYVVRRAEAGSHSPTSGERQASS